MVWRKGLWFPKLDCGYDAGGVLVRGLSRTLTMPGETKPRRRVSPRTASCLPPPSGRPRRRKPLLQRQRPRLSRGAKFREPVCGPQASSAPRTYKMVCRKRDKSYPHPQRLIPAVRDLTQGSWLSPPTPASENRQCK